MTDPTPPAPERHKERTDTPGWDTKQRCICGYESVSRAEQWKHVADALRGQHDALTAKLAAAEARVERLEAALLELTKHGGTNGFMSRADIVRIATAAFGGHP